MRALLSPGVTTIFRLRDVLASRGMSQRELARLSGVSEPTINRLCSNRTAQVSLATLDRLAAALEVEPGALLVRVPSRRKG